MAVRKIDRAEEFETEFPRCLPWLITAHNLSTSGVSFESIISGLLERDYQLWTTEHAACISLITEWEGKRVCCLFLIGGEKGKAMPEILAAIPDLEAHAIKHECKGLLGIGRALWARVLPKVGFQVVNQNGECDAYFKDLIDEYTEGKHD